MLVLSRKRHERIIIGEDIVVEVVWVCDGSVWLGIEAPRNVNIRRAEVPPERPEDTAIQENMERKHGSFRGPDPISLEMDPRNRDR